MRSGLFLLLILIVGCGQTSSDRLKIARPQMNARQQKAVNADPLAGALFILGDGGRYCLNLSSVLDSIKKKGDDLVRLNLKDLSLLNANKEVITDKHTNQFFFKKTQLILDVAKANTIDNSDNSNFKNFLSFKQIDCSRAVLELGDQSREFDIDQTALRTASTTGARNQQASFRLPQTTQGLIKLVDRKNRDEWTFSLKNSSLELKILEGSISMDDPTSHCPPQVTAKVQKIYRFDWGSARTQDLKISDTLTKLFLQLGGEETVWSKANSSRFKGLPDEKPRFNSDNQISESLYKEYTERLQKFELSSCGAEPASIPNQK